MFTVSLPSTLLIYSLCRDHAMHPRNIATDTHHEGGKKTKTGSVTQNIIHEERIYKIKQETTYVKTPNRDTIYPLVSTLA